MRAGESSIRGDPDSSMACRGMFVVRRCRIFLWKGSGNLGSLMLFNRDGLVVANK